MAMVCIGAVGKAVRVVLEAVEGRINILERLPHFEKDETTLWRHGLVGFCFQECRVV